MFFLANPVPPGGLSLLDMEKDGVNVIEVPANSGPGTLNDAFFRFVVDMGPPGPDRKKGGTYGILPPGQSEKST